MKKMISNFLLCLFLIGFSFQAMAEGNLQGEINVNNATMEQLMLLPRVGEAKAKLILDFVKNNKVTKLEELLQIKGIGEKTLSKWKPYIKFTGSTTLKNLT